MRTLLRVILTLTIMLALGAFATAQENLPLRANIPFDFVVGDATMPAGHYTFSAGASATAVVAGEGRKAFAIAPLVLEGKAGSTNLVVFHRIGETYYLAEVWPAQSTLGRLVGGSATMKRGQETMVAQKVTVLAETVRASRLK